jgi:hypothetical protein
VQVQCPIPKCPYPSKPVLKALDVDKTLCHPDNFNTILQNMNNIVKYSKELEGTIDCYDTSLGVKR